MDRFKFRVWDENRKRVEQSHYVLTQGGSLMYCIDRKHQKDWIVEQCTGLKDKNGKLIYEGDIIHVCHADLQVKWFVTEWILYGSKKHEDDWETWDSFNDFNLEDMEIIGNIHEDNNG